MVFMRQAHGNALFLILIAVALFAALSYAVTNSGRGGSGIDSEKADILAAQIFNEAAAIQSAYQRLEIIGGYDQVLFNDSAETTSGTCYDGGNTVSAGSCHTIGVFNAENGIVAPFWSEDMRDPEFSASQTNIWNWNSRRLQVNSTDLGTDASDEYLIVRAVRDELCEAINRKVNDDPTINTPAVLATPDGYAKIAYDIDGTFGSVVATTTATNNGADLPNLGCLVDSGGRNLVYFVLKEN